MTHGSLFSGIGGFDLGFERAGFKTIWQVEIDEYCQKVLAKNFPDAERYGDIRECGRHNLKPIDVISGGFPCQDISNAGKRIGIDGERSGLWSEMWRVICEVRPRFVVVENVAALLGRGIERVLGDLAACGFDAEWDVLPACAFGAPHRRDRIFIVAYPMRDGWIGRRRKEGNLFPEKRTTESKKQFRHRRINRISPLGEAMVNSDPRCKSREGSIVQQFPSAFRDREAIESCTSSKTVVDADQSRLEGWQLQQQCASEWPSGQGCLADTPKYGLEKRREAARLRSTGLTEGSWWAVEPDVGRVAHGVPARVDRLKGLGNAVVPQIAEWIGERIARLYE